MDDKLIGRNIQLVRYRRGLNQAQLADAVQLDRTAISRIEQGRRALTASELVRVARALEVEVTDLLEEEPGKPQLPASARLLMRAGSVDVDDRPQLYWFLTLCSRAAECAKPRPSVAVGPRTHRLPPVQAGELAARRVRASLGLGPTDAVSGLSECATNLGLLIALARLPSRSKIAGCLVLEPRGLGAILINSNHPAARQRYTLAHEIAHSLLHAESRVRACDTMGTPRPGRRSLDELQADIFASAFLLPKRAIASTLREQGVTVDTIHQLAERYGVSHAATLARLRGLGLISHAESRALRRLAPVVDRMDSAPPFRRISSSFANALADDFSLEGAAQGVEITADGEVLP